MLGVELADRLTTTEATGDDGVALAELLTITDAARDDDGETLAEMLIEGVDD